MINNCIYHLMELPSNAVDTLSQVPYLYKPIRQPYCPGCCTSAARIDLLGLIETTGWNLCLDACQTPTRLMPLQHFIYEKRDSLTACNIIKITASTLPSVFPFLKLRMSKRLFNPTTDGVILFIY